MPDAEGARRRRSAVAEVLRDYKRHNLYPDSAFGLGRVTMDEWVDRIEAALGIDGQSGGEAEG